VWVTVALPLLVVALEVMVAGAVVVKFTGNPSGIAPELEVSSP